MRVGVQQGYRPLPFLWTGINTPLILSLSNHSCILRQAHHERVLLLADMRVLLLVDIDIGIDLAPALVYLTLIDFADNLVHNL